MKIKKVILLTLSFLLSVSTAGVKAETSASAVEGKKKTLFNSSSHASTPYRIPAIATLSNGEVIAIADQRPCGADVGNGEVDIYAKISSDGGATWNPSSTDPSVDGGLKIADGSSSNGYGDAAVVANRDNGEVMVICVAGNVVFSSGSSSKHNKMARLYSSDYGKTWKVEDVTTAFFDDLLPDAYTMFMASGKMVQSKKVKVGDYYRIYGALLVRESGPNHNNYVVYSDDFGKTWAILGKTKACGGKYSSVSFLAGNYADEAKVEELPNGDIVVSSRKSGGRYFNVFNFADIENDKTSGSWGTATSVSFAGSNSTNGEILLYQGVTKVGETSGTKYNVMLQSLPTGSSRSNVSVYYKAYDTSKSTWSVSDFTSGWTKGIEVDEGASAYSTMDILPNGEIGFLYEDNYDTSKANGDYSDIVFVPLTVEEITGGVYTYVAETPVVETVSTPVISPESGEITAETEITITCATDGAVIYYTTDGSAPSTSSTQYTEAFTLSASATVKAIAVKEGWNNSEVAGAEFTVKEETPTTEPVEVTPFECTINGESYKLSTYSASYVSEMPAGIKAYYVKQVSDNKAELTRVSSTQLVPANTGVILVSDGSVTAIEMSPSSEEASSVSGNLLVGTCESEFTVDASTYGSVYFLNFDESTQEAGFYKAANGGKAGKHKAYLQLGSTQAAMMSSLVLSFDDEDGIVTGIDTITEEETSAAEYYTVQGVKVANPGKGVYIKRQGGKAVKVVL